jgi:rare lipoprotein A
VSNHPVLIAFMAAALFVGGGGVAHAAPGIAGMGHVRSGLASWYGARHEGLRMANGCRFRSAVPSAASRVLPIGAWVRVTNRRNHRSLMVEVTDRGPYVGGRVLDLSRAAAVELDMIAAGIVMVEIERVSGLHVGCRRVG